MTKHENTLNRRSFVKWGTGIGIATSSVLPPHSSSSKTTPMKYRVLGKTKLKVSEVGFGTYGFSNSGLLEEALDQGINFINTCADYQHGTAEEAVGKVLKTRRKDAIVFTGWICNPRTKKADLLQSLDGSLKRLQTDYIDIIKTHNVADPSWLDNDALYEAFEEAKKAGKVGFLGVSSHSGVRSEVLLKALKKKAFDIFQFKYNYMEKPELEPKIFAGAQKQNIGIVVFKSQAGKRQNEIKGLEQKGLTFAQATTRWTLQNPAIHSVCVAINTFQDIQEYQQALSKQFGQAEHEMLKRYASAVDQQYCRYCSTCEPSCPHHVAIADIMRYSMYFKYYKMEKEAMSLYAQVPVVHQVSACHECPGYCTEACPHKRPVRDGLLEAEQMLV